MKQLAGMCLVFLLPCAALPCSLCVNVKQAPTFRIEASQPSAHLIFHGILDNAKLRGDIAGAGTTEFRIVEAIKDNAALPPAYRKKKGDVLLLPLYIPVEDPKSPPHYLLFCSATRNGLAPYRPIALTSERTVEYVKAALALPANDVSAALSFFFRHLDHPDRQVSNDAFLEFAKASDRDIGELGKTLKPDRLRRWLQDPQTPEERLGLYAFLLGACGTKDDANWFTRVLGKPTEKQTTAYDGLLGGYIQMHPREGWDMAERLLREGRQPLPVRLAAVRTLRFFMAWKGAETRAVVRRCLAGMLAQGELSDLAADDLRRLKMWDLTADVLAQFGRKGLDAPIQRRAVLRYALSCPRPEARAFVAEVRKRHEELVSEVEEGLRGLEER